LFPYKLVQVILTDGPIHALAAIGIPITIGTEASIIVEFSLGCPGGSPVKSIAAFAADQETLK